MFCGQRIKWVLDETGRKLVITVDQDRGIDDLAEVLSGDGVVNYTDIIEVMPINEKEEKTDNNIVNVLNIKRNNLIDAEG